MVMMIKISTPVMITIAMTVRMIYYEEEEEWGDGGGDDVNPNFDNPVNFYDFNDIN